MQMIELIYAVGSFVLGIVIGYYYGLSLIKQEKALSTAFFLPLIRIVILALLGMFLLHWGIIPFILFIMSFIVMMWGTIFIHNR